MVNVPLPADGVYSLVSDMFETMLTMVKTGERMNLPESRYGDKDRPILQTHPKELTFALREAINVARGAQQKALLEKGHFQKYPRFKELVELLDKKSADAKADAGDEAKQRRELVLYDHEQVDLFESILRCSVAAEQECNAHGKRKPIDTLTLGVITSVYFALGARGLNLDDTNHGYLSITRWNAKTWETLSPLVLRLKNAAKGDSAGATKHMQDIMHHRDPMRCAACPPAEISLIADATTSRLSPAQVPHRHARSVLFAYQFFTLQDALPTIDSWKSDAMHTRPLIRKLTGGAATVTEYNATLRQDLKLIGANTEFTFHCIRDQRGAEAGERGDDQADIYAGMGHAYGSHTKNYRATNASWVLGGAGYGRDPEEMAAHVKALYQELDGGSVDKIVTMLYQQWRPELLELEKTAATMEGVAGERMTTWLHMVRTTQLHAVPHSSTRLHPTPTNSTHPPRLLPTHRCATASVRGS